MQRLADVARAILDTTLAAIEPEGVVRRQVARRGSQLAVGSEEIELDDYRRIVAVGFGKAAMGMARAVAGLLSDRRIDGLVATSAEGDAPDGWQRFRSGHPLPNDASLAAADAALALLRAADAADTIVLFLVSGGGSAMLERPRRPEWTLADLRAANQVLVTCGARIDEINTVRRRLSAVKGGRLAAAARHSRQVSLYLSDVNPGDLASIASGPTVADPDAGAAGDARLRAIVERYDLGNRLPAVVAAGLEPELPVPAGPAEPARPARPAPQRSHHVLLDNAIMLDVAARIARERHGLCVEVARGLEEDDVATLAAELLSRVDDLRRRHPGRAVGLLSGGEAVCPVRGSGRGGRNQELALRTALAMVESGRSDVALLSAGTDGLDGNSPAAGAVADDTSVARGAALGLGAVEHLLRSDSYPFFEALGDAIEIGPTGNNVRDLRIVLAR